MRDFTRRLFQHCPMLVKFQSKVEEFNRAIQQLHFESMELEKAFSDNQAASRGGARNAATVKREKDEHERNLAAVAKKRENVEKEMRVPPLFACIQLKGTRK